MSALVIFSFSVAGFFFGSNLQVCVCAVHCAAIHHQPCLQIRQIRADVVDGGVACRGEQPPRADLPTGLPTRARNSIIGKLFFSSLNAAAARLKYLERRIPNFKSGFQ
jgi:hypothetical protein